MAKRDEVSCPPVFIPCRNLPDSNNTEASQYSVRELCAASEKTSGYNSMIGAQRIGGLWRLYPKSFEHRNALLSKGISIRNIRVTPFDKNPFLVRSPNPNAQGGFVEREAPTTKVIIGNLPLSYSNDDIERKLVQLGAEPHSKLMMERERDEKGGLTRWLTGRRFVYVKVPSHPLPDKFSVGPATATLYHREQKQNPENATCSRCLTKGHRAATCNKDIVCRTCQQPGHKSGHQDCTLAPNPNDQRNDDLSPQAGTQAQATPVQTQQPTSSLILAEFPTPASPQPNSPVLAATKPRGRSASLQSRFAFRSRSQSRSRDKRPLSDVTSPPAAESAKSARVEDPSADPKAAPDT